MQENIITYIVFVMFFPCGNLFNIWGYYIMNSLFCQSDLYDNIEVINHYKTRKLKNIYIASLFESIGCPYYADKINNCMSWLEMRVDKNNKHYVTKTNRCNNKFCMICGSIKSNNHYMDVMRKYNVIVRDYPNAEFLLLTCSLPNVPARHLRQRILLYNRKFRALVKYFPYYLGACKSIEITYNDAKNSYHPHIHALICVDKNYFNGYMKNHDELLQRWASLCGVDVNRANLFISHIDNSFIRCGVRECVKYSFKYQNIFNGVISRDSVILRDLMRSLDKIRLFDTLGLFRSVQPEPSDDVKFVGKPIYYYWSGGTYIEK